MESSDTVLIQYHIVWVIRGSERGEILPSTDNQKKNKDLQDDQHKSQARKSLVRQLITVLPT
jgi:hypothetical protein